MNLGIDIIEAGFPIASNFRFFQAVTEISKILKKFFNSWTFKTF